LKSIYLVCLIPGIIYGASIKVSGNPQPLIIHKAKAGKEPESAVDTSTTYTLQVPPNATTTLSVSIDSPMPEGTNLFVSLSTPGEHNKSPTIPLKVVPQVVLTRILAGIYEDLTITYEYSATVAAGIVPLSSKNIVFTLTENIP
jgi:hypothetical protein